MQKTLFQAIRTSDLPPSEMSSERMGIEAEAVATAGAETTATALTQAIYLLLAHPSSLDRLRKELLPVYPDPNRKSNLASLRELPYLVGFIPPHAAVVGGSLILGEKTAVIKETLRISPNITSRLPLLSHTELQYGKWRIPAMVRLLNPNSRGPRIEISIYISVLNFPKLLRLIQIRKCLNNNCRRPSAPRL